MPNEFLTFKEVYHMRKNLLGMVVLACVVCLIGNIIFAAPFEPLFKVKKITGKCKICLPDAAKFLAAEDGKAYPYGSKIKTGRKSSLVIEFSEGNECRVLANATLAVTEDTKDKKLKTVELDAGKIEVTLEEGFRKNNGLNVETATAICGAIGCKYNVHAQRKRDLDIVVIVCTEGSINAHGLGFKIPLMKGGNAVSISRSRDKVFTRVKNIKGTFIITITGSDGKPKDVEVIAGSVIKIWQRVSDAGDAIVITILITDPEGKLLESITYTQELDEKPKPEPKPEPEPGPTTTTTTFPPATTTTTVPSPTPVGKR